LTERSFRLTFIIGVPSLPTVQIGRAVLALQEETKKKTVSCIWIFMPRRPEKRNLPPVCYGIQSPKLQVGQVVCALDDLTNSSGTIVRAKRDELMRVVEICPLPGFVIVKPCRGNQFGTMICNVRPLTTTEKGELGRG
jgi:hypothetical protein